MRTSLAPLLLLLLAPLALAAPYTPCHAPYDTPAAAAFETPCFATLATLGAGAVQVMAGAAGSDETPYPPDQLSRAVDAGSAARGAPSGTPPSMSRRIARRTRGSSSLGGGGGGGAAAAARALRRPQSTDQFQRRGAA